MGSYTITGPDRRSVTLNAPDGATPEQIQAKIASIKSGWQGDAADTMTADDMFRMTAPGTPEAAAQHAAILKHNGVLREPPNGPRFGDGLKDYFGGHNPIAETYDKFVDPFIPSAPATKGEAEQQKWLTSRNLAQRAGDAASFAAGVPVRALTQGKYGAGDALTYFGFPGAGQSVSGSEQDFSRANAPQLEALDAAASVGAGTIGVPSARIPSPKIAREFNPELPAMRAQEAVKDAAAFDNLNVRPFGPAFSQGPVASVAKQLSDTPFIGAPVRNALEESIRGAGDAAQNIAGRYGEARDARQAGLTAQEGLFRYKDARPQDIVDSRVGALTDESLQGIIDQPASATSLKTKQGALYEQAWREIPEEKQRGRSAKDEARVMGGPSNTRAVIDEIVARNARMTLQTGNNAVNASELNPVQGGLLKRMVEAVQNGKWTANYQTMRDMRSEFRRLASGMSDTERNTLRVSDMERIQSAITQDMIAQLTRNADAAGEQQNHGLATRYMRAIDRFKAADQYTRQSMERLETIERLFNASSVESLSQNITRAALDKGRGNVDMLKAIRRVLRPEEIGDISAAMLSELGKPVGSARGLAQEIGFSPSSFTTRWNNMAPEAKGALFNGPHRAALDDLARVVSRLANVEALGNTSRSGTNTLNMTGAIGAAGAFASGQAAGAIGIGAAGLGTSILLSRPAYVKWATQYAKLRASAMSGSRGAVAPLHVLINRLNTMAKSDPALVPLAAQISQQNGDRNGR